MQSENYKNFFADFNIYNYVTFVFVRLLLVNFKENFAPK